MKETKQDKEQEKKFEEDMMMVQTSDHVHHSPPSHASLLQLDSSIHQQSALNLDLISQQTQQFNMIQAAKEAETPENSEEIFFQNLEVSDDIKAPSLITSKSTAAPIMLESKPAMTKNAQIGTNESQLSFLTTLEAEMKKSPKPAE